MNTLEAFDLEAFEIELEQQVAPAVEQTAPEYDETSTEVQGDVWDRRCKEVAIAGFVLAVILKLPTPELTDFALIVRPFLAVAAYSVAKLGITDAIGSSWPVGDHHKAAITKHVLFAQPSLANCAKSLTTPPFQLINQTTKP